MNNKYVVIEGADGVGKSTLIDTLKKIYPEFDFIAEPYLTDKGRSLMKLIERGKNAYNLLCFSAAREHYENLIKEKLVNKNVIGDRSFFSSIPYSVYDDEKKYNKVRFDLFDSVSRLLGWVKPDLVLILVSDDDERVFKDEYYKGDKKEYERIKAGF